jgi:hypothetical protein
LIENEIAVTVGSSHKIYLDLSTAELRMPHLYAYLDEIDATGKCEAVPVPAQLNMCGGMSQLVLRWQ